MTIEGTADKGTLREALEAARREVAHRFDQGPCMGPRQGCAACTIDAALSSKDERAALTPDRADRWVEHDGFATRRLATPPDADREGLLDDLIERWHVWNATVDDDLKVMLGLRLMQDAFDALPNLARSSSPDSPRERA